MLIRTCIHYVRIRISQTAPLLSRPRDKAMASFGRDFWPLVDLYQVVFDWKVQRFCWPKGTSLECAESIYVKITEAACVCNDFIRRRKKKKKKMDKS